MLMHRDVFTNMCVYMCVRTHVCVCVCVCVCVTVCGVSVCLYQL